MRSLGAALDQHLRLPIIKSIRGPESGMSLNSRVSTRGIATLLTGVKVPADRSVGLAPNSTKRRLFPLKGIPSSTFTGLRMSGDYFSAEWHSHPSFGFDDCCDHLSDSHSSSSSGTVKISALSDIDLPDAGMDFASDDRESFEAHNLPYAPFHARQELGSPHHKTSPTSLKAINAVGEREGNVADSALSDQTNRSIQRRVRWNSYAEINNLENHPGFGTTRSLPDIRAAAHRNRLDLGNIESVIPVSMDKAPLNDKFHRISLWDTSIKLCTATTLAPNGNIDLHHHAQLCLIIPKQDISAKRIRICFYVANGVGCDRTFHLDSSQSSLFFKSDSLPLSTERHEARIDVFRETSDAEEPLDVYITTSYPTSISDPTAWLPVFRPENGQVLSESLFIAEPTPPLIVKALLRNQFSTWTSDRPDSGQILRFERKKLPKLYPEGLKDDLGMKIIKPPPLPFPSIVGTRGSEIVWDLMVEVERILGLELECHMSLWLEIGTANTLLCIDPQGWIPRLFLVDNNLASEAGGEWRQHEGHLILFKQAHMLPGPMKIEMTWQEPAERNFMDKDCIYQIVLPRIIDREISSGMFRCQGTGSAFFSDLEVGDHSYSCKQGVGIRLPPLRKGSELCLKQLPHQPSRECSSGIPVEMELAPSSSTKTLDRPTSSEAESNARPGSQSGNATPRDADDDDDDSSENVRFDRPPRKHLVVQAIVAWFIILSLFLALEISRNQMENKEPLLADSSLLSETSELEGFDTGTNSHMASVDVESIAHNKIYMNEEGEGWRDWVDTALGWKGYTP